MARAVNAESQLLLNQADKAKATLQDPSKREQVASASKGVADARDHFAKITDVLAPVASDAACKATIEKAGRALQETAGYLLSAAKTAGVDPRGLAALEESNRRLADALRNLLGVTDLPPVAGAKEAEDFTEAAQAILQSTAAIMASTGNPAVS